MKFLVFLILSLTSPIFIYAEGAFEEKTSSKEDVFETDISFFEWSEMKTIVFHRKKQDKEEKMRLFFEGIEPVELQPRANTKFFHYVGSQQLSLYSGKDFNNSKKKPLMQVHLPESDKIMILVFVQNGQTKALSIDVSQKAIPLQHLKVMNISRDRMAVRVDQQYIGIDSYGSKLLQFQENENLDLLQVAIENKKAKTWRMVYSSKLDVQYKRALALIYRSPSNRAWKVLRIPWHKLQ